MSNSMRPKPWTVVESTRTLTNSNTKETIEIPEYSICEVGGLPVAQVHLGLTLKTARLIAAAPELLAMLERIERLGVVEFSRTSMGSLRALIRKATGGAE